MVKLRIKEVARDKKEVRTAYQLQKLMNVPPGTAARLWRANMKKIALSTIDALCEALSCEVSDIIVRVPDKTKQRQRKN
jgi:DNA-binding Xre family transcriptional regulator